MLIEYNEFGEPIRVINFDFDLSFFVRDRDRIKFEKYFFGREVLLKNPEGARFIPYDNKDSPKTPDEIKNFSTFLIYGDFIVTHLVY